MEDLAEMEDLRLPTTGGLLEKRHRQDLEEEQGLAGIHTHPANQFIIFRGLAAEPDLAEAPGANILWKAIHLPMAAQAASASSASDNYIIPAARSA